LTKAEQADILTADDKSRMVTDDRFTFLNCIIDRREQVVILPNGRKINWWNPNLRSILAKNNSDLYKPNGKKE